MSSVPMPRDLSEEAVVEKAKAWAYTPVGGKATDRPLIDAVAALLGAERAEADAAKGGDRG